MPAINISAKRDEPKTDASGSGREPPRPPVKVASAAPDGEQPENNPLRLHSMRLPIRMKEHSSAKTIAKEVPMLASTAVSSALPNQKSVVVPVLSTLAIAVGSAALSSLLVASNHVAIGQLCNLCGMVATIAMGAYFVLAKR